MYKQCRTEQSAARQRALEQGLLETMMKCHYDEITVRDLCEYMQIPRKSFYRYFSNKEGALHALIDHALMDFDSFSPESTVQGEKLPASEIERLFAYWKHQKPLLDALAGSGLSGILIQRAIDHTILENVRGMRFFSLDEPHAQEYAAMFIASGLMSMVVQWHHDGYTQSIQSMANTTMRLLSHPIAEGMK